MNKCASEIHRLMLGNILPRPPFCFKSVTAMVEWIAEGKLHSLFEEKIQTQQKLDAQTASCEALSHKLTQEDAAKEDLRTQLKLARDKISKLSIDIESLKRKGARLKLMPSKPLLQLAEDSNSLTARRQQIINIARGRKRTSAIAFDGEDPTEERVETPKRTKIVDALADCGLERLVAYSDAFVLKCLEANSTVKQDLIVDTFRRLRQHISAEDIMRLCDEGLSDSLYNRLVQLVKKGMQAMNVDDSSVCPLPLLGHKKESRVTLNAEAEQLLGIESIHESEEGSCAVRVDVSKLLCALVSLYGIPPTETLHVKVQIDETPFFADHKLERASIKIMNFALDRSLKAFKIQSEYELFPIAFAYVKKEGAIELKRELQWLNNILTASHLTLNGSDYQVEWHLACDLKATKLLLGLKMGATGDICHICSATYAERANFAPSLETMCDYLLRDSYF